MTDRRKFHLYGVPVTPLSELPRGYIPKDVSGSRTKQKEYIVYLLSCIANPAPGCTRRTIDEKVASAIHEIKTFLPTNVRRTAQDRIDGRYRLRSTGLIRPKTELMMWANLFKQHQL